MSRAVPLTTLAVLLFAHTGCAPVQDPHVRGDMNRWIAESYHNDATDNAARRQRALFPHHFDIGRRQLNQIGHQQLVALAPLYRAEPGTLHVRRGDASQSLYDARLEAVREALAQLGVEADHVRFADGLPGGDGISSDRAASIMGAPAAPRPTGNRTLTTTPR